MNKAYAVTKRALDITGASLALVALAIIIGISALMVWSEDRSAGPFIRQQRIARGEGSFYLIKLRTMRSERFRNGRKLSDAERMLRCGAVFRKYSIDELPQFLNVVLGDMSLIGPRPMPIVYLPYLTPTERLRHLVRPGMSGLAQISGRNFLSWDQKFTLDVEYVAKFGLLGDIKILCRTLMRLLRPQDVGIRGEDLPIISLHEEREPWRESAAVSASSIGANHV